MRLQTSFNIFVISVLFSSCSTVNLASRKEKDLQINFADSVNLKGRYSNLAMDTVYSDKTLFNIFRDDNFGKEKSFVVDLIPINNKAIKINLIDQDSILKSVTLKGKYKKGYFRVKRDYNSNFIFGPLIWVLGEHRNFIGLTKTNNLVILDSGGQSFLLFVIFPFFGGSGNSIELEYKKTN
jgi:hypothetical protein